MDVRATRLAFAALGLALIAVPSRAQESATLLDASLVVTGITNRFEAMADLDGNGSRDILDWWWDNSGGDDIDVTGWLSAGDGTFTDAWEFGIDFPVKTAFMDVLTAIGDLNGDALDDFAISSVGYTYLYTSNRSGLPTLHGQIVTPGFDPTDIVLADVDDDGLDDVVITTGNVTVHINQGDGTFIQVEPQWNTMGAGDDEIVLLDANGDGELDLVDLNFGGAFVYYMVDGALQGSDNYAHGLGTDHEEMRLAAGDVDNDGDVDVTIFHELTGEYALLRNGPGGLVMEAPRTGGPATDLCDVNDDGFLDGVCCGGSGGGSYNTGSSKFMIALNDGTGVFAPSFQIASVGAHHIAGVDDVDGDGDVDLVAGRTIYYARGPIDGPIQPFYGQLDDSGFEGTTARHVADGNGDGDLDVRFGADGVVSNRGDGTFVLEPVQAPLAPNGIPWTGPGYPGDFDGDGDLDLVTTWVSPNFRGNYLLRNNGSGVLANDGPCTDGLMNMHPSLFGWGLAGGTTAADVDADGDLDLFVHSSEAGGSSRLWWNDGTGFFTHAGDWPFRVQHVIDLDGDTQLDLVFGGVEPTVAYGLGGGAFEPTVSLGDVPMHSKDILAVLDVDDDSDLDIVVSVEDITSTWILVNDGARNFPIDDVTFQSYPTSPNTLKRVYAGDLNGDGEDDLVLYPARDAGSSSWIFLQSSTGPGFEAPVKQTVFPAGMVDMDDDGDLDVLSQSVEGWVANPRWHGASAGVMRQFGEGTPGTGGVTPVLGASGPFREGETVYINVTGLRPGSIGVITVGFASSDLPNTPWLGVSAYTWPWATFFYLLSPPGEPGVDGSSKMALPFVVDPIAAAFTSIYHQVYWGDPGATFGKSASNGLDIDYGN